MTKIYITILSLITVIAIMAGCFIHIFGRGHFSWDWRNGGGKSVSDTIELSGDIDTIKVDIDYAGLTIAYGDDIHVEYTLPDNFIPEIELKNGTLSVIQKNSIRLGGSGWNDFSVTIVIPKETALDSLDLDIDAGEIKIADIPCEDVAIKCDAGNIELSNINSKDMDVNVDAGNIELTDCTADKMNIKADAGNIQLEDCTIDVFHADADAGNIEADNCTINSGEVRTDLGNISLDGEIGDVKTHTSLGIIND